MSLASRVATRPTTSRPALLCSAYLTFVALSRKTPNGGPSQKKVLPKVSGPAFVRLVAPNQQTTSVCPAECSLLHV